MNFTTRARMSAWESRDGLTSTPEKEDDGSDTIPSITTRFAKKRIRHADH
jgi:hypothetical protein